MTKEQAIETLNKEAGIKWDPAVVEILKKVVLTLTKRK